MRDVSDLEWALGIGMTRFVRSTFGGMLERAECASRDSDGHHIPSVDPSQVWHTMMPKRQQGEPCYEPDSSDLERFARVSRRLLAVSRHSHTSYAVLCAYYGDSGARWGREAMGRDASLYPLTGSGQRILTAGVGAARGLDLRDDERIAADIAVQAVQPQDTRRRRHERMRDEARVLLGAAHAAWNMAAAASERRAA